MTTADDGNEQISPPLPKIDGLTDETVVAIL